MSAEPQRRSGRKRANEEEAPAEAPAAKQTKNNKGKKGGKKGTSDATDLIDATKDKNTTYQIHDDWFQERGPMWKGIAQSLLIKKPLYHQRSLFQDIMVFESETFGHVLVLDGVIQCTERDEFSYQEMITHLAMFSHANPKKVLVVGGGDGGVLREVIKHDSVESVTLCEIDQGVIDVSKKWLPHMAAGFNDDRVHVHVGDGFAFMQEHQNEFDVIITDSSDPIGPADVLFKAPYYEAMKSALTPHGVVITQGESQWLHLDIIEELLRFSRELYTSAEYAFTTIPTYPGGQIGFVICSTRGPCNTPIREASPEFLAKCRYYTPAVHRAAFMLPKFAADKLQLKA